MILLDGTKVASHMQQNLKNYFSDAYFVDKYLAIFLLSQDVPSRVYVSMKQKFGSQVGIKTYIFGKDFCNIFDKNLEYLKQVDELDFQKLDNILQSIDFLNKDEKCLGMIFQLPLSSDLEPHKAQILGAISPLKDVDGLGGILFGLSSIGYINFMPATPAAVINLLEYYNLADFEGKNVVVLGQSNLVGKPLAVEIINRLGSVYSFNHLSDKGFLKGMCKRSDYIISATGKINLVQEDFVRDDGTQILVDVGWAKMNGKTSGDMDFEKLQKKVKAITPVPGGVGPVTVASLFNNIKVIHSQLDKIKKVI